MSGRHICLAILTLAIVLAVSTPASAQAFGIGPRFSLVRGDLPSATPSTRFIGGTMRLRSSKHVVLEAAMDYRADVGTDQKTRIRQTPFQASLLLFPVRSTFAPYLLGGFGIYTVMHDTLGPAGVILTTVSERTTGWHLGGGAELNMTRHAALFVDYRFRFVRFGDVAEGDTPINIPIKIPGISKFSLSHHGSMWTSGMAFYF